MQYIDVYTWLRGDILVKADRMSMAHSLECGCRSWTGGLRGRGRHPGRLKLPPKSTDDQVRPAPGAARRRAAGHREPQEARLPHAHPGVAEEGHVRVGARHPDPLGRGTNCSTWRTPRNLLERTARGRGQVREVWTILVFCIWHAIFVERRSTRASAQASALLTKPVVGSMVS
jgi:asparagine synthase (glutamine-hydrolysing)